MDRSEGQEEYSKKRTARAKAMKLGRTWLVGGIGGKKIKMMKYSDMSEGM